MVGQPIGGLVSEAARYPVLLHGFMGSSDAWGERIIDGLAGAGLPPVLVDLPGHGKEAGGPDPKRYTRDATLDLIAAAGCPAMSNRFGPKTTLPPFSNE